MRLILSYPSVLFPPVVRAQASVQQVKHGGPDVPLPGSVSQLLLEDPEAFSNRVLALLRRLIPLGWRSHVEPLLRAPHLPSTAEPGPPAQEAHFGSFSGCRLKLVTAADGWNVGRPINPDLCLQTHREDPAQRCTVSLSPVL